MLPGQRKYQNTKTVICLLHVNIDNYMIIVILDQLL